MSISKRVRDQAALICAISASGGVWDDGWSRWDRTYDAIANELDACQDARDLALHAYCHVRDGSYGGWTREVDAEAESIIRTGWSPC